MGVFARFRRKTKDSDEASATKGTAETPMAVETVEAPSEAAAGADAEATSEAGTDARERADKEPAEPAAADAAAEPTGSAGTDGAADPDGAADADGVEIPKQQSAEAAADNEAGEGARK